MTHISRLLLSSLINMLNQWFLYIYLYTLVLKIPTKTDDVGSSHIYKFGHHHIGFIILFVI